MFVVNLEKRFIQTMLRPLISFTGVLGLIAVVVLYPVTIAIIALVAQSILCIFSIVSTILANRRDKKEPVAAGSWTKNYVFSVHVPTHNEPPDLVIVTLQSLRDQQFAPRYEVIVIDNNTDDPALWRPVESWCARNAGFRFFHRDGVAGAKAGALNIALEKTRPDATHIVITDADYRVSPRFLEIAATELQARAVDYIQFPQSYLGCDKTGAGIALELGDYFERHANAANHAGAMLLTGTLSVILRTALLRVGGWPGRTATEDADLGLRLCETGYRSAYVQRIVGQGLLPLTLGALHSQRYRWVSGNMRTLLLWVSEQIKGWPSARRSTLMRKMLVASQLTAWANFALPAVIALGISAMTSALDLTDGVQLSAGLAVVTLTVLLFSSLLPLCLARRSKRAHIWSAICSRVAMLPSAAAATIAGMLPGDQAFQVTPKSLDDGLAQPADFPLSTIVSLIAGGCFLGLGLTLESVLICFGGIILILPPLAAGYTARALSGYSSVLGMKGV